MNREFWAMMQRCWRTALTDEDRRRLDAKAGSHADALSTAKMTAKYSRNPLDDMEDDDDEDY